MTEYERNIAVNGLRDDVVKLASQATCIHKGIVAGSLEDVLLQAEILHERAHTYESNDNCTATRAALKVIDNHVEALRMLAKIDTGETVTIPAEAPAEVPADVPADVPAEKPAEADYMLHISTGTGSIDLDPAGLLCLPVASVRRVARLAYADANGWAGNLDKIRDFCRPLQGERQTTAKSRARILQIWTDLDPAVTAETAPAEADTVQLSRTAGAAVKRIAKSAGKILHGITGYHTDGTTVCITDGYHGVSYPGTAIPGLSVDVDKDHPRDIIRSTARDYQYHPGLDGLNLKAVKALQRTGMDGHGNAATHVHVGGVGYYNLQQLVNILSAIDASCDCYVRPERHNTYTLIFAAGDVYGVVTPCNWTASNVERNSWIAVDLPASSGSVAMPADTPAADTPAADTPAINTTPAPVLDADTIAAALQPAEQPAEDPVPTKDPSIMDRLQAIPGLDITTRKSTIWIAGQTYPVRAQLKAMGCKWSAKRKAWYYQAPRPAAVIPAGLTVIKQTSACTWVDGPTDLLQAAGAKWSAKRQAWYVA